MRASCYGSEGNGGDRRVVDCGKEPIEEAHIPVRGEPNTAVELLPIDHLVGVASTVGARGLRRAWRQTSRGGPGPVAER